MPTCFQTTINAFETFLEKCEKMSSKEINNVILKNVLKR